MNIKVYKGKSKSFRIKNPILDEGCIAYETDTHKIKVGDGNTEYNDILYASDSAYENWLSLGNEGTIKDFIDSLKGKNGKDGKSAYESWISLGYSGKEIDFIKWLKGKSAYELWLDDGNDGTEQDFIKWIKGKSAYELWIDDGNEGSESDFISNISNAVQSGAKINSIETRLKDLEENMADYLFEIASDDAINSLIED